MLSAFLSVYQFTTVGRPYSLSSGGRDLILDHVDYGSALDKGDFESTVLADLGDIISDATPATHDTKAVLSAVKR